MSGGISNHYDAMQVIVASINAFALSGSPTVTLQEVANYQDGQSVLPFISVSPYGPEKTGEELNDRDGWYYGTLVAIIAKPSIDNLEQRLGWRQTLRRRLNNISLSDLITKYSLGLPSLGQNYNLKIEPGNVVEPAVWKERNGFVSGMIVRTYFQEPRV